MSIIQVELLESIHRLAEHFAASAFSIMQSRSFDGVCIVVLGCIAAVSDAIIRKMATDEPSEACSHLMGRTVNGRQLGHPGFGLSVGTFATQTETIEVPYPELCVARTAVLDYFQSPAQRRLQKIYTWEDEYPLRPNQYLIKYLRMVARSMALATSSAPSLLSDGWPLRSHIVSAHRGIQYIV